MALALTSHNISSISFCLLLKELLKIVFKNWCLSEAAFIWSPHFSFLFSVNNHIYCNSIAATKKLIRTINVSTKIKFKFFKKLTLIDRKLYTFMAQWLDFYRKNGNYRHSRYPNFSVRMIIYLFFNSFK